MHSKDDLIVAAKALAASRGTRRLKLAEFQRALKIDTSFVYRHFDSWGELCRAAGLEPAVQNTKLADEVIFCAMRDAFLTCGGIVPRHKMQRHLPFSTHVLVRRFKTWPKALSEFDSWAQMSAPNFPYLDQVAPRSSDAPSAPRPMPPHQWSSKGVRPCGDPIGFRALAHAPVNEQGVILAFGAIAHDLGYAVEAIAAAFPDCIAKRRVGEGRWESVRIEFEYRSRNFRDHGHAAEGCDVIVCWEHDWPSCPLEVLELKSAIAGLKAG